MVNLTLLRQEFPNYHVVQWRLPALAWGQAPPVRDVFDAKQPLLLRFTTDTFMEDFMTVVTQSPQRLWEWRLRRETWRKPAPVPPLHRPAATLPAAEADSEDPQLVEEQPVPKLYQPTHQRYYLVTASLVCRTPGLPDKALSSQNQEKVSFVLRRLMPASSSGNDDAEYALVDDRWQRVADDPAAPRLLPGEAQFAMFPATYRESGGYTRRIFSGLVPVSARERFLNAGRHPETDSDSTAGEGDRLDQLVTVLLMDVVVPWRTINRQLIIPNEAPEDARLGPVKTLIQESVEAISDDEDSAIAFTRVTTTVGAIRDQLQLSSWYILLDFASYLKTYLNPVWQALANPSLVSTLPSAQQNLYAALNAQQFEAVEGFTDFQNALLAEGEGLAPAFTPQEIQAQYLHALVEGVVPGEDAPTLTAALLAVDAARDNLEAATDDYVNGQMAGWPTTKFLLCGLAVRDFVNQLEPLIKAALEAAPLPNQRIPLTPIARQISQTTQPADHASDRFMIRCVYERPHCPPSLHPTVVSQPTAAFQMASYFDPDAPARPIRIPMPIDTSPAGLRKYAKNTAFIISDTLSCQLDKVNSLTFGDLVLSVLPWPFNKKLNTDKAECSSQGGINIGQICSLSIPIITLCALILLMIVVQLLDIIFKWVPYLIFCLPLPGLSARNPGEEEA